MSPAVYVQTNDAAANEVVAFSRASDGALTQLGRYATGGLGTGVPHLPSAGSLVLAENGQWLLVANAGSDDLSLFAIEPDGLRLAGRTESGGRTPTSIAVNGSLVYALNNGTPNVTGFRLSGGQLTPLEGSARTLSGAGADPAQVGFAPDGRVLVVTERGTDSISRFRVNEEGFAHDLLTFRSSGPTPYGFDFTASGLLIVSEAFGGRPGEAAASLYVLPGGGGGLSLVTGSVGDTRSEVCWVVVDGDDRYAYVTNFGDSTVSRYEITADGLELRDPVAATGRDGARGLRDEALTADGRFLYAIDADAQQVVGWAAGPDGTLTRAGHSDGLPRTVAGLAAS